MAYKFEDKFVHFRYDASLKGKKVFYADSISCLEDDVTKGEDCRILLGACESDLYPFLIEGRESEGESASNWKFVYYDPNYEAKLAYEKGKKIQFLTTENEWLDCRNKPDWSEYTKYRIKPETTAYVILNRDDGVPKLLWKFDIEEENRYIYYRGSLRECAEYIDSHIKFASVMQAWEDGKTIQFKKAGCSVWVNVLEEPVWSVDIDYRIKPEEDNVREVLEWTALNIGDIIETFIGRHRKAMVTEIDFTGAYDAHIRAGYWLKDKELENWRKVRV